MRVAVGVAALVLVFAWTVGEAQGPIPEPVVKAVDKALGQVIPPALNTTYAILGQNITREDVRISLWANFTKGDVNALGLLVGSGRAEIQVAIHGRLELRVISSDRIRAAITGENAYNVSAENATFLSQVYLPAEVFRATLSAEAIAAFQRGEEDALSRYLRATVPDMEVLALDFTWSNVSPTLVVKDTSLTEPPIVLELDLVVQYLRIESIPSLLQAYFESAHGAPNTGKDAFVKRMKQDSGKPLRERDFFAAAAYTQLLNLSMQPGWSLDIYLHLPRGYSFTYFNDQVESKDSRSAALHVDAHAAPAQVHKVFLASLTQRKIVALALLSAVWLVGLVVGFPARFLYGRYRLPRMKAK